ncbi:MAG TPA: spermidine synthase [Bacillota bacterium]
MSRPLLEILAYEPTPLGLICLRRRELLSRPGTIVTEITLDHELLISSHVTESERRLARLALEMHNGDGLRVLVGGLGLGYTVREVLTSPPERVACVEVVELLPQVIDWLNRDLTPLAAELKADHRLRVVQGDIYARLAGPVPPAEQRAAAGDPGRRPALPEATAPWDLVLIDVDHSPDEPLGSTDTAFYTEAGLRRAARHLAPHGVLAVWSYAPHSPFAEALRRVFPEVRVEPVTVFNDLVREEQTDWLFLARNGG